jgi:hypothetical protein
VTCKGCRAEIKWIKTTGLASMPVDVDEVSVSLLPLRHAAVATLADPRRLTIVTRDGKTETGYLCSAAQAGARQVIGHVPHWATCPHAKEFKARQEAKETPP